MNTRRLHFSVAVGLAAVLSGCQTGLNTEQATLYREAQEEYAKGDYFDVTLILTRFTEKAPPKAPEVPGALYMRGLAHAHIGNRPAAYADLRKCISVAREPEVLSRAYASLGQLYFDDGNWDLAVVNLRSATSRMADSTQKRDVLARLDQALARQRGGTVAPPTVVRQSPRTAPPPAATAAPVSAAPAPTGNYAVQAGVFSKRAGAERRLAELRRGGFDARIEQEPRGGAPMHVVLVGRYASEGHARQAVAQVKRVVPDAVLWP